MKNKGAGFYPPDISVPYLLKVDDKIIVNFPMDHYVYEYGSADRLLKNKKLVSSNNVRQFPMPLTSDDEKIPPQEMWNFRIQTPHYEPLFYHDKAKLYTRAVHHSQNLKFKDGTLNDDRFRSTTIIILDQDLNIVGETIFKNGSYPTHGAVPLSDGLLIYPRSSGFPILKYKFINKH